MRSLARTNRLIDTILIENRELKRRVARLEQAFAVAFPGRFQVQLSLDDARSRKL